MLLLAQTARYQAPVCRKPLAAELEMVARVEVSNLNEQTFASTFSSLGAFTDCIRFSALSVNLSRSDSLFRRWLE